MACRLRISASRLHGGMECLGCWGVAQPALPHLTFNAVCSLTSARLCRSKLSARSRSVDLLPAKRASQSEEQPQLSQQQQAVLQPRGRSSPPGMPVDSGNSSTAASVLAAAAACAGSAGAGVPESSSGSSSSSGQRGRTAVPGSQLRPPRPPPLQQPPEPRSPFDVYNVASAVASVLLPSLAPSSQQQQQRQLEHQPPESDQDTPKLAVGSGWRLMASSVGGGGGGSQGRRSAEAEEVPLLGGGAGGEGWESVDASEASLTLPQRNFSTAHLLAPMVGRSTVAGVSPPPRRPLQRRRLVGAGRLLRPGARQGEQQTGTAAPFASALS